MLKQFILGAICLMLLASCTPFQDQPKKPALVFEAPVKVGPKGEVTVNLQVQNPGSISLPQEPDFGGTMEIHDLSNHLLARVELRSLGPLRSKEQVDLVTWKSTLPAGTYRMTWGAPSHGSVVVAFKIVEKNGALSMAWVTEEAETAK